MLIRPRVQSPKGKHSVKGIFSCAKQLTTAVIILLPISFVQAGTNSGMSNAIAISLPVVAGVYTATIDDYEGFKQFTVTTLATAQLTALLKFSVRRERPNGDNDLSFPSGHAASAFMGASYMHHRYGLAWGLPFYAVATVISFQRVNVDAHYWTDVIAGAALGWGLAKYFTTCYPNAKCELQVDPSNRAVGVRFSTSFG